MKNITREWIDEGTNAIRINWEKESFYFYSKIIWRGIDLKIRFNLRINQYTQKIDIIFEWYNKKPKFVFNRDLRHSYEDFKISPALQVDNYELKLILSENSLVFTEEPKKSIQDSPHDTADVFTLNQHQYLYDISLPNSGNGEHLQRKPHESKNLFKNKSIIQDYEINEYFENEDLIIDQKISLNVIDKKLKMIIKEMETFKLYNLFGLSKHNKYDLLNAIAEYFKGSKCYFNFRYFLEKKNVKYEEEYKGPKN